MSGRFFREWLFQLVVGVSLATTIATLALLNKYWNWPNAIVGAVLLLCGTLYLMEKLGIGPSTRSRVRDWIDSSNFNIQTVQDANEFHFVLTDNVGIKTDILQPKTGSPVTIASAKHVATPEQLAAFKALAKPQQREFWQGVRLELLRYGVQFSNLSLDGEGVTFSEDVMVGRTFTATEFFKRLLFVRSAARLYWELLLALHDATPLGSATESRTPK